MAKLTFKEQVKRSREVIRKEREKLELAYEDAKELVDISEDAEEQMLYVLDRLSEA